MTYKKTQTEYLVRKRSERRLLNKLKLKKKEKRVLGQLHM